MTSAIPGASRTATIGTMTASAITRADAWRLMASAGGDNNTIGNNVQTGMVHSETMSVPVASATGTGASSMVQNATTMKRRGPSGGTRLSMSAARVGRIASAAINTGSAA